MSMNVSVQEEIGGEDSRQRTKRLLGRAAIYGA